MNTPKNIQTLLLALALCLLSFDASAQSRAERRAAQEREEAALKAEVAQIVESGNFSLRLVFVPDRDINLSGGGASLQDERTITIRNDSIFGELPFFGRSSVSSFQSTGGGGFTFEDPIQTGEITKRNRGYLVSLLVNHPGESLNITIEIGFTGEASMVIRSNRRANARYAGVIQHVAPRWVIAN